MGTDGSARTDDPNRGSIQCPRCGADNTPAAGLCHSCGMALPEIIDQAAAAPIPPPPPMPHRASSTEGMTTVAASSASTVTREPSERQTAMVVLMGLAGLLAAVLAIAAWGSGSAAIFWASAVVAIVPTVLAIRAAIRGPRRVLAGALAGLLVLVVAISGAVALGGCDSQLHPGGQLGACDFSGSDLSGLDLSGADLSEADLSGADLSRTNLSQSNLSEADLTRARLDRTRLASANLTGAVLRESAVNHPELANANLTSADLSGLDLQRAALDGVALTNATLVGANLVGIGLSGAQLDGADLTSAQLDDVFAEEANLAGAVLTGASLTSAVLSRSNLAGAKLDGANLQGAMLDGATLTDATLTGARLDDTFVIGATGLTDAMLSDALGVPPEQLGAATRDRGIELADFFEIQSALGAACRGEPVTTAEPFEGDGPHPTVVVGLDGQPNFDLDDEFRSWAPTAARYGRLVGCVGPEVEITVEVCEYVSEDGGPAPPTRRLRFERTVTLVEAMTAETVFEETFQGSSPDECPFVKQSFGSGEQIMEGSHVDLGEVRVAFAQHVK